MTLIELFDREMAENAASVLLLRPEKVVFLGFRGQMTRKHQRDFRRFFKLMEQHCETEFIPVDRYDKTAIQEVLLTVLRKNPECAFDVTGGSELALIAMGELSRHMGISMHQIRMEDGSVIAVSGRAPKVLGKAELSAAENILLHGGRIISSEEKGWSDTPAFRESVQQLWSFCREDPNIMNRHAGFFNTADSLGGLSVSCPLRRGQRSPDPEFLKNLSRLGFLRELVFTETEIRFTYRDGDIRRLFTKAGNLLEVYVWLAAKEAGIFQDARQGVMLDWDAESDTASETKNEVDVLVMRGLIPGFISCKNGNVKKDALYELETVAERFGGTYAKKILAVTSLEVGPSSAAHLKRRAEDSGIILLDGVNRLTLPQLSERLCRIFE